MENYTLLYMQDTAVSVLGFLCWFEGFCCFGWLVWVFFSPLWQMRCLLKESKGSVICSAVAFKPLSCPCPYSWTVVPEINV